MGEQGKKLAVGPIQMFEWRSYGINVYARLLLVLTITSPQNAVPFKSAASFYANFCYNKSSLKGDFKYIPCVGIQNG